MIISIQGATTTSKHVATTSIPVFGIAKGSDFSKDLQVVK